MNYINVEVIYTKKVKLQFKYDKDILKINFLKEAESRKKECNEQITINISDPFTPSDY